jgi:hypothetical protein
MSHLHDDFPPHAQAREEAMSKDAAKIQVGSVAFGPPNPEENTFEGMMARLMPAVLSDPQTNERPTLRDHFAMAALTGNMANPNIRFQSFDEMATESYQMADAMTKARGE